MHEKLSRNASCHCGSGKKYKYCCLQKEFNGTINLPALNGDSANVLSHLSPTLQQPKPQSKVRVGVDYTFTDAAGTGEVGYAFEQGQLFVLTNGIVVDAEHLTTGMQFQLQGGLVATVTKVDLPKVWDPPSSTRDSDGNSVRRIIGTIKYTGYYPVLELHYGGQQIKTTPGHPFFSLSRGGWVDAGSLSPGEYLRDEKGNAVPVEHVFPLRVQLINLYNVEVEDYHTYFVGGGGKPTVWSHNGMGNGCTIPKPAEAIAKRAEFKVGGARRIDGLREATHDDVLKAFEGTGLQPSNHFIKRVLEERTAELGMRSFSDVETIIRKGRLVDAEDGLKAWVHNFGE